jgi:acylglycerol lipase
MPTEEGSHTLADGQKLYTKTWKVRGSKEPCPGAPLIHVADGRCGSGTTGLYPRLLRCEFST